MIRFFWVTRGISCKFSRKVIAGKSTQPSPAMTRKPCTSMHETIRNMNLFFFQKTSHPKPAIWINSWSLQVRIDTALIKTVVAKPYHWDGKRCGNPCLQKKGGVSSRASNLEKSMQTQFGKAVISRMIAIRLNGDSHPRKGKKVDESVKLCSPNFFYFNQI